jgi:hypothetical protein
LDASLIDQIEEAERKAGKRSKDAVGWFKDKLDLLRGVGKAPTTSRPTSLARFPSDTEKTFLSPKMNLRSVGRMIMYVYDPKLKAKLPYYDVLPLVIVVNADARGFTGLNLHYVPPLARQVILEALRKNINKGPIPSGRITRHEQLQIRMNYSILKRSSQFPLMKSCFKRYLFSHVRSSFMYISPDEWEKSVLLPTERFVKATKQRVFKESMAKADATLKPNKPRADKPKSEPDVRTTEFFRPKGGK